VTVFERLRDDVLRAQIKQERKRDEKFAARALGVRRRRIIAAFETADGKGLAVYYFPAVPLRNTVRLVRVGYDGAAYGEPVEFPPGGAAIAHMQSGGWREV
jgi:hypothetical protein